jgi:hypothetical protein
VFGDRGYAGKPAAVAREDQDGLAALRGLGSGRPGRPRRRAHFAAYREAAARPGLRAAACAARRD